MIKWQICQYKYFLTQKIRTMSYYPLAPGNSWTYKTNDGSTFTNAVISEAGGMFTMTNSTVAHETHVKKEASTFLTDSYEAGNMQPFLKDDAAAGESKWH
jgi:hypothetical protein